MSVFRIALLGVFMIYMSSCKNKLTYKQAIRKSHGSVVDLSWNKQYIQEDTLIYESASLQAPIKIVIY